MNSSRSSRKVGGTIITDDVKAKINALIVSAKQRRVTKLKLKDAIYIPDIIGDLIDLKDLTFSNCNISTLPETIGDLINLKKLKLINCDITTLPDTIGNLENLMDLHIENCDITTLPDTIEYLAELSELTVLDCKLNTLPDTIGNLPNLSQLILDGNELTSIPDTIGNLPNLYELSLDGNELTTLPDTICYLSRLAHLHFSDNPIINLPSCFFGNFLDRVEIAIDGDINRFNKPLSKSPLSKLMTKKSKINDLTRGYDAMNISRQTIYTFLKEDPDNIVFITNGNAELTNLNTIESVYNDAIVFECYKAGTMRKENINFTNPLFNLRKIGLTVANYTYVQQIDYIMNNPSKTRIYDLEKGNAVNSVVSQDVLDGGTYVSSQHCQEGQGADVYNIIEVVNTRTKPSKVRSKIKSKSKKSSKSNSSKTRKISSMY